MKYEELVADIKKSYEKADAAAVSEHVAVQVNVVGEGEGAFYIEVADGKVSVEPYEYYDRDAVITTTAEEILNIAKGKSTIAAALEAHQIDLSGNSNKALLLGDIKLKKTRTRKPKAVVEETPTEEAPAKRRCCRKPAAEKTVKEVTPATGKTKRATKTAKKG